MIQAWQPVQPKTRQSAFIHSGVGPMLGDTPGPRVLLTPYLSATGGDP